MLCALGGLVEAGDDATTAGGTYPGGGEGSGIEDAFRGQLIDARRLGVRVAVAAEVWANIFGTEPEDVGTLAGACACNKQRREEKENSFHDCWEFAC